MSTSDMKKAREWAAEIAESRQTNIRPDAFAAAEIIQSLPDQWIDAEKVREVISEVLASTLRGTVGRQVAEDYAALIGELIPTPPLPTLAEMTPEERERCQWMQAMFTKSDHEHVITCIFANKSRLMRRDDGMGFEVPNDEIIPLSDLPPMKWPGSHADTITAESVEDVQAGRVADFEPALPRPEDVPAGEPWLVKYDGHDWVGTRELEEETSWPWALARLDGADYSMARDSDITLVSRLVPEDKP